MLRAPTVFARLVRLRRRSFYFAMPLKIFYEIINFFHLLLIITKITKKISQKDREKSGVDLTHSKR